MLTIELDSIKRGLIFGEKQFADGTYQGYLNADGQKEGAGFTHRNNCSYEYGEYHHEKLNGIGKADYINGINYWGQFKDNKREGYGTEFQASKGITYTGQFKNDKKHGYGHLQLMNGSFYYGQWKENKIEGYGFYKFPYGDEYDGEWKDGKRTGVGVFKREATGTIKRCNFKDDKKISVIEVIKPRGQRVIKSSKNNFSSESIYS